MPCLRLRRRRDQAVQDSRAAADDGGDDRQTAGVRDYYLICIFDVPRVVNSYSIHYLPLALALTFSNEIAKYSSVPAMQLLLQQNRIRKNHQPFPLVAPNPAPNISPPSNPPLGGATKPNDLKNSS